jgi:mannose-6-phosphate isomerase
VGDCILIEAGTVHALGGGLLIAEIQQASDTTFRLFDWNRVDRDGKPRQLHVAQALGVIDFARGPVEPQRPQPAGRPGVERLAACDKFVLDRRRLNSVTTLAAENRFHILAVVEGEIRVSAGDVSHTLRRGGTLLVPAACEAVSFEPRGDSSLLDMYLP